MSKLAPSDPKHLNNSMKKTLQEGYHVVGTMVCELRTPAIPRLLSLAGLDYFIMDTEHGTFSMESVTDFCNVARAEGITPIVRIPEIRKEAVSRTLDAGAQGLLVPQVYTAKEVESVIKWAKFAPLGERGVALGRANTDYRKGVATEWMARVNEETLLMIQIETKEALDEVEAIAALPGVDVLFVGPNDLASSLGVPGSLNHPKLIQAIERVIEVAAANGIAAGIHVFDLEAAAKWRDKGIAVVTVLNDLTMILETAQNAVDQLGRTS